MTKNEREENDTTKERGNETKKKKQTFDSETFQLNLPMYCSLPLKSLAN